MAIGLFDVQGGASVNPQYELTSPVFDKITIHLNGKPLNSFHFPHSEFIKGGTLDIELGPQPNKQWGIE